MMFNLPNVGDKIRLTHMLEGRLTTYPTESEYVGQEGLVLQVYADDRRALVRMLDAMQNTIIDKYTDKWEVIETGCELVYRKNPEELRIERLNEFQAKMLAHDVTHQGFTNPATFLAALYLDNDSNFYHKWIPANLRKNGTVNPSKVEKYFGKHHKVDAWAFACPIGVPEEFKKTYIPGLKAKMSVKWGEVALHVVKEHHLE